MTAGFCWKWSKKPKGDGGLEMYVKIGDYERPWNARHDSTRLAKGIPKAHLWAYDPGVELIRSAAYTRPRVCVPVEKCGGWRSTKTNQYPLRSVDSRC